MVSWKGSYRAWKRLRYRKLFRMNSIIEIYTTNQIDNKVAQSAVTMFYKVLTRNRFCEDR
jgi:hypothetical protein